MRVCVVYDCLFPYTVGGAERWYRNLAERLAAEGHEVTYLTLRQWDRADSPELEGDVRVVAAGPRIALYTADGRRRILPPLVFGLGVLLHLLRSGRRYDVVHSASFPYFSLLAAGIARPLGRFALVVDWHEVWSGRYWREYLGPLGGPIGGLVQRLCARVPQRAFCFSQLHAARLRREGLRGEVTVLEGEYAGSREPARRAAADAVVVFAGRLIPEKRATLAVAALPPPPRGSPDCAASCSATAPSVPRCWTRSTRTGCSGRSARPASSPPSASSRRCERDVHAVDLAARGLWPGRRRGGRARHPERRRQRRGQRRGGADRGGRQRLRGGRPRPADDR